MGGQMGTDLSLPVMSEEYTSTNENQVFKNRDRERVICKHEMMNIDDKETHCFERVR
jgi:hypothetical protein